MKDHRRKQQQQRGNLILGGVGVGSWKPRSASSSSSSSGGRTSFWCTLTVILLSAITFSTFRLFGVSFRPVLITTWQQAPALSAISAASSSTDPLLLRPRPTSHNIHQAVSFPDQVLLFLLNHPSQTPLITAADSLPQCLYFPPSSPRPNLHLTPISVDLPRRIVRCPLHPRGFRLSLGGAVGGDGVDDHHLLFPPVQPRRWDALAYESLLDRSDNSTIVFVKGLNLRPGRLSDATRYECVFGWDFARSHYLLTSDALFAAQEIVRCRTPLSVLRRHSTTTAATAAEQSQLPVLVSVKAKGRGSTILHSVAWPVPIPPSSQKQKKHRMCVCTMVRNQARFLNEWIRYHARIGVERWFIYDNNSDDNIDQVVGVMNGYNVTRHVWPWVKTQEAGFAHCALRSRDSCEWVGFIDVDEFLYLPSPELSLYDVLQNYSMGFPWVGELRTVCHTFGPSGHKVAPPHGVMMGYTCRMAAPERHKSIIRPEALSSSLINVVHHFHLKDGFRYVNMDRGVMVINHYKYQVWQVFKEKFYRRVATYVADWQDRENVGSKDRAPGLGTKAVEPPDWSSRFCEVKDTGLRDRVLRVFVDPDSGLPPW